MRAGRIRKQDGNETDSGITHFLKRPNNNSPHSGTFANMNDSLCEECELDEYSESEANEVCTSCSAGKGTITSGSTSSNNCTGIILFRISKQSRRVVQ